MCAGKGALDASTGDHLGDGTRKGKVGEEAAVAGGDWNQPAWTINEGSHGGCGDLDSFITRGFQALSDVAHADLIQVRYAVANGDIFGGINVGIEKR